LGAVYALLSEHYAFLGGIGNAYRFRFIFSHDSLLEG
jgi:hypothetical protein